MGLLTVGTPLTWDETKKLSEHVRRHGIAQFVNLYRQTEHREDTEFRFGDEIEYQLVEFDDKERRVRLCLKAGEFLEILQEEEHNANATSNTVDTLWRPEYAGYMIEGTPGRPYCASLRSARCVERNMRLRRKQIKRILPPGCEVLTLTAFPLLGCPDFCSPAAKCTPTDPNSVARSLFFPDSAIFSHHPRFANLTRNIRKRRGEKVVINCPIFRDSNTPWPFHEPLNLHVKDAEKNGTTKQNGHSDPQSDCWAQREHCGAAKPNSVYLDAMGFGMGLCCLQVTFQARNVASARALHDQLVPVAPLMLALTAATPIMRGYLIDTDARWYIISAAVDDRTPAERGCSTLACGAACAPENCNCGPGETRQLSKSRYDSVDMYLTSAAERYNDVPIVYNDRDYDELLAGGVDETLAKHVAHLFIRDTISLFAERVNLDDENETDHFENIQSTNWQSLRFKPPPSGAADAPIGWRVEFRSMEVQPSDMANAAFITFILLLARAIKAFGLNFCMPMSKVEENMQRSQTRDACRQQRFLWRRNVLPRGFSLSDDSFDLERDRQSEECAYEMDDSEAVVEEMTIDEIFNGSDRFAGLIPLIRKYLRVANSNPASPTIGSPPNANNPLNDSRKDDARSSDCMADALSDDQTNAILERHLAFIGGKASGRLLTFAQSLRRFVRSHPDYRSDSVVNQTVAYDLCKLAVAISRNEVSEMDLTDDFVFFPQQEANHLNTNFNSSSK